MKDVAKRERESWLTLRAQSGDREALDELLKSVQEQLFRYIKSLVGEDYAAEEVLQETLGRIYRKLGWLRDPQMFRAWSYRIASREAFRHLRRERKWTEQIRDESVLNVVSSKPPPQQREGEFDSEMLARLSQTVENLSASARAVVVLYYLHELSLGEVAAALEIPVGTVKSRLAYGLASLRRQLKQEPDNERRRAE
jgi:RNA polymerase sigma-70 factor, ECF subfamily